MTHSPELSAPSRVREGRIADIEVLRAFAITLVLVQHVPRHLVPFMRGDHGPLYGNFGFWSGVDLFFAISGFVIARSLLPSLDAAHGRRAFVTATLGFWVRRAWRLLPSAWLWGVVVILLAATFNRSGTFGGLQSVAAAVAAAVLQVANLRLVHVGLRELYAVTTIYWTLSLEEQFYFVLPLIALVARSRLPIVLAVVVLAQLFLPRTGPHGSPFLNLTRSDALALGVLLAIWAGGRSYQRLEPRWLIRKPWRWLVAPVFLTIFAFVTGPSFGLDAIRVGALALLAAGIVWAASYDRDYVWPAGALRQALCWLGARSYAIYLIHQPINHATVEFWSRVNPRMLEASWPHVGFLLLTALPVTLVLAELNYRFVEVPLRRHGVAIAARITRRGAYAAGEPVAAFSS
jgi:peptidoglycan/LPS O-acetylase OafA/YrhL